MHITQNSLATMSIEAIRAERDRQETVNHDAQNAIALCSQVIIDRLAEFKVGDWVVGIIGDRWLVTRVTILTGESPECVKYYGRRIQKDGTVGAVDKEIFACMLRTVDG